MYRIESLLSARLFISPKLVGNRIFFISNLSGHLSLYAMDHGGSVPEPLLPPQIALQNPHLIGGEPYFVFPDSGKILVMIDRDGDENYQPMIIPLDGGFPEPAFEGFFEGTRVHLGECDAENKIVYLIAESRASEAITTYQGNLSTGELVKLAETPWGTYPNGHTADHRRVLLMEGYTFGDSVLFLWERGKTNRVLMGKPILDRAEGEQVPLYGFSSMNFTSDEKSALCLTSFFKDTYSPAELDLNATQDLHPVEVNGLKHSGVGEMTGIYGLEGARFALDYNIDGVSWLYEAEYDAERKEFDVKHVLVGEGTLANGMLESFYYDKPGDRFILSFSSATSPTQIYSIEGQERNLIIRHTREKVLGIPQDLLSDGEDASYTSYDGTRISARLYLPAKELGFTGSRPLVYYVHGGPQGQERPDFAWFSMPLIQYLTLNGFAVFVPNVRGSTGYGMRYTKQVDHDWGGYDRLDHVEAMKILEKDKRVDVHRAGVVGRSYGGYMTLTLAARHPELWKGAVDMFGPFDLITFSERIPETWKPYFRIALGDPVTDADFLKERSPRTHIEQITCPLLVIQGKNDPRVVERESHDLVEYLRSIGKQVDYLMFENEGHDVLKYENRVRCYTEITEFFKKTLQP
ncbi:prolyl oligopeptidase family [Longilinea arvoryzae]|uniref:Acyl-peptide hydrolase n=1 Tax=Longilinea arvoryzae TaxID=360412 RepID=A0A0S7BLU7_9CHLR|nr:alpha/beta fold hydrolase [Longilinea arvoryzae]GAP14650.1 prolyl oligopeptidase family [Longilinea arvoryzae]